MEPYEEKQFYELVQQPQYPALGHVEPEGRIPYGRYAYWRRKRQMRRMRQMLVMSAIAFGMIAAITFQAVNYGAEQLLGIGNTPENAVLTISDTQETAAAGFQESVYTRNDVSDVVSEAMPSIVSITGRSIQEIPDSILDNIKIASFGDSDSLRVGTQVVAIGNALGYGQSATSGYVSALNQRLGFGNSTAATYIQTDAAINPGNSGGALLNMQGEVIGINAAKIADDEVEGMGFAIPASVAIPVLERLMA